MNIIKAALCGANGRMGQAILKQLEADPKIELVATLVRSAHLSFIPVTTHTNKNSDPNKNAATNKTTDTSNVDVFIDFSVREALTTHLEYCAAHKIAMVIGITGLSESEKKALQTASLKIPIVYAANMSIAMNVNFKLLDLATRIFNQKFGGEANIAIHEVHHRHKKDAPSGTALKMKEVIVNAKAREHPNTSGISNTGEVPISSLRTGEVSGEHTVLFSLPGEQLEIVHKAADRTIFARGAVEAAKWVYNKPKGLYDMQDVLELRD